MKYLEIEENVLEKKGAQLTAQEIVQQPRIWNDIHNLILNCKDKLQLFLEEAYHEVDSIILTGAGSSSFIGTSLSGTFFKNCGLNTKAVATTDLVTHPDNYFNKRKSILIISFARSGNSPESYAALELADEMSAKCFHLIITCNSQGNITLFKTDNPKFLLLLPPESNDQGLAMTSSYTGMLLAGTLVTRIKDFQSVYSQVNLLYKYGERIFQAYLPLIKSVAKKDFKRVIFLGSGALYGAAMESHLKIQELTDGKVICKYDTFLGFRHGPKSVIDETTLLVYLFSNIGYVNKYEKDLVESMKKGRKSLLEIGIAEHSDFNSGVEMPIIFSDNEERLDESFMAICAVLPAQILAFFKSLDLGLEPDSPSASGAISRVVEGVSIYSLT